MAELDGKVALVAGAGMGSAAAAGKETSAAIANWGRLDILDNDAGRASFVTGDVVRVDGGLAIRGD